MNDVEIPIGQNPKEPSMREIESEIEARMDVFVAHGDWDKANNNAYCHIVAHCLWFAQHYGVRGAFAILRGVTDELRYGWAFEFTGPRTYPYDQGFSDQLEGIDWTFGMTENEKNKQHGLDPLRPRF